MKQQDIGEILSTEFVVNIRQQNKTAKRKKKWDRKAAAEKEKNKRRERFQTEVKNKSNIILSRILHFNCSFPLLLIFLVLQPL